jgi:acetyl-CoA acetyltransferase
LRAADGADPQLLGIGPVEAANRTLGRAGISWSHLDVVKLNEAFASQSLACLRSWPELDPSIVNINGRAIAMGHPLGCRVAPIIGSLVHERHHCGGGWGPAAICIGVGQCLAVVLRA